MRRRLLHLIAWLSVAAYFLTNTHANLMIAAALNRPACQEVPSSGSSKKCQHCQNKAAVPQSPSGTSSCPVSPDQPFEPGCPCCPLGDQPCSVPGGCAMCSVAKTPCVGCMLLTHLVAPFLGEVDCEVTPVYAPPFCDGLIRPPKA
jgi:hypothetical protein